MLTSQISTKELADWSFRVGLSINAGFDLLQTLSREGQHPTASRCWQNVARSVAGGDSLHEALVQQRGRFTPFFLALVKDGEQSSHLGETLLALAEYYEQMNRLQKTFFRSILLPVCELVISLVIIGIVIVVFVGGILADIFGPGPAVIISLLFYLAFLAALFGLGHGIYRYLKNNAKRLHLVQRLVNPIYKIGPALRTLALFRLTQSLHLTMKIGMDVQEAIRLSFQAAAYGPITNKLPIVLREIKAGGTIFDGFLACRCFDQNLLKFLQSGEKSGVLREAMQRLSKYYYQKYVQDV